ncbi:MAG TPA: hypothetical protein VEU97_00845 [Ktedonobacteraceae bacterium]|nr:hypothetical protein [Ktedonobacteraceae bacterium]
MKPSTETTEPTKQAAQNPLSPHHRHVFTPKWAAVIGALAIGVLYLALPGHLTFGPSWIPLTLEILLFIPLIFSWATRRPLKQRTIRLLALLLLGVVTTGLAISITLLVITLPTNRQASTLLSSAALLWCSNILVFALWYWEIDCGGPHQRFHSDHQAVDLMFPQQIDGNKTGWAPQFVDYLFVAFTGATALSPTDTYPLTRKAKALMMIEAMLSIIIIILLAARAVNILGS